MLQQRHTKVRTTLGTTASHPTPWHFQTNSKHAKDYPWQGMITVLVSSTIKSILNRQRFDKCQFWGHPFLKLKATTERKSFSFFLIKKYQKLWCSVIIFWNTWFSAPHYGEFILHRLALRSAIDQGIETRFDASENGVAAAIASRDYYVIANQNATIKLVEKQSQKLVRTIQTRTPSRVVDLKVLKLRRQEFLVWMEESGHTRSLGIFELHQVKHCCIQLFNL